MPSRLKSIIVPSLFPSSEEDQTVNRQFPPMILQSLHKVLPHDFFEERDNAARKKMLEKLLPLIASSKTEIFPGVISFFALSRYRQNSFKFFFEMISRWLVPGRRLIVVQANATDFRLVPQSAEIYSISEMFVSIFDKEEYEEIQRNYPIIENEIALGIDSEFYAQRILEIKGLSKDDKTALIQEYLSYLLKRFPGHYDVDVFSEMQHLLVACREEFKAARQGRHLCRIIGIQYLFRNALREAIKKNSLRRHLNLKIFRSNIQTTNGPKRVLSLLIGVSFLREQENLGEKHLLKAIQHCISGALSIENSFFIHKLGSENIGIFYMEVEKKDGSNFSASEIRKLRKELPLSLKNRVEHRLHNLFMPRNEEEVMRNILTLTNQIKYVSDIPQVLITFDEQAYAHLYFTIILARLLKPESCPIGSLFKKAETNVEYLHERTKVMGYVRKRYPKEATVFRLKVPKEGFIRADNSIDLYKARQAVVKQLLKIVGDIRDYNGGMISKEHELLSDIRKILSTVKDYDELLLENFFYSLSPVVVRALLNPDAFKTLFLMLLEGLKEYKHEEDLFKFRTVSANTFVLLIVEDFSIKDKIHQALQELHIPSTDLAVAHVRTHGNKCIGYIYSSNDPERQEQFLQLIAGTVKIPALISC
jgi:hypothetical protein